MPGAKRRLKKLLSPHSHSHHDSDSPESPVGASPIDVPVLNHDPHVGVGDGLGGTTARMDGLSVSPHPAQNGDGAMSPLSGEETNALLKEMDSREQAIGSGHASQLTSPTPTPETQSLKSVNSMGGLATSPSPPSPRKHSLGMGGGVPVQKGEGGRVLSVEDLLSVGQGGDKGKKKSSRQRFMEREARKKEAMIAAAPQVDPQETAKLEREKHEEEEVVMKTCEALGVQLHEIEPDGHCMYSAIADQLHLLGKLNKPLYANTRHAAATYLRENAETFMPFVPSVMGEDMAGAGDDKDEGGGEAMYGEYCKRVEQSGDWGGEIEIQALSRYYNVPIHVIQRGPPTIISHTPGEEGSGAISAQDSVKAGDVVRISYHRRMYGLGEHYNSLRPIKAASSASLNDLPAM